MFVCCLSASCPQTSSSCGSFPSLHVKPVNETKSPGERVRRAAERSPLLCEKARHWLNLKEKLRDLFPVTVLTEQSADPQAEGSCSGLEVSCIFVLGLLPQGETFASDAKKWLVVGKRNSKHLSYRSAFQLYCFHSVMGYPALNSLAKSAKLGCLHLFLSHPLCPGFRIRLLVSSQSSRPQAALTWAAREWDQPFLGWE